MDANYNYRKFAVKSITFVVLLAAAIFILKFPVEYFGLSMFKMNEATSVFNKSDTIKIGTLSILFFGLYFKKQISSIEHAKRKLTPTIFFAIQGLIFSGLFLILRFSANLHELSGGRNLFIAQITGTAILAAAFFSFLFSVYTYDYFREFLFRFRKQIIITAALSVAALLAMTYFEKLWPYFSASISTALYHIFSLMYPTYLELGSTPLLDVNGFEVSIGEACCGIESLFLFIVFSTGIYMIDHSRIKGKNFAFTAAIGLAGAYILNILRLALLILAGLIFSPAFAIGLFHTNIGWILFASYFIAFYFMLKKIAYNNNEKTKEEDERAGKTRYTV